MLNIILRTILVLIALSFIISSGSKFFKRGQSATLFKFAVTSVLWVSVVVLTVFPGLAHQINRYLGFGENLNTLIFIGFVMTFVLIFKLLNIIENTERTITDLVRKDALRNMKRIE